MDSVRLLHYAGAVGRGAAGSPWASRRRQTPGPGLLFAALPPRSGPRTAEICADFAPDLKSGHAQASGGREAIGYEFARRMCCFGRVVACDDCKCRDAGAAPGGQVALPEAGLGFCGALRSNSAATAAAALRQG